MNFRSSSMCYAAKCPSLGGEMSTVGPRPYTSRQHINPPLQRPPAEYASTHPCGGSEMISIIRHLTMADSAIYRIRWI